MKNNVVKIVIFVRCVICFDKPIEVYRKDCTFLELILLILEYEFNFKIYLKMIFHSNVLYKL